MRISDSTPTEVSAALSERGVGIQFGDYEFRLQSPLDEVARAVHTLYGDRELRTPKQCPHFRVRIDPGMNKFRRCVYGSVNGQIWQRWPRRLTVGALEWVCNWCFFRGAAQKLSLHAAAAEVPTREGAIVFPGLSGAGKSTLAATLMLSGWRLLSDEVALFDLTNQQLTALGRSTVLKGGSLQLIRDAFPEDAVFGPAGRTLDPPGPIAHLRPSSESTKMCGQKIKPLAFCFPERRSGVKASLELLDTGTCFSRLSQLGLNYRFLGPEGFDTLLGLSKKFAAFKLLYSNATDAEKLLRDLSIGGNLLANISAHLGSHERLERQVTKASVEQISLENLAAPVKTPKASLQTCSQSNASQSLREPLHSAPVPQIELNDSLTPVRRQLITALRGKLDWNALNLQDWDKLLLLANHLELAAQLATRITRDSESLAIPPEVTSTLANAAQTVAFNHKNHNFELQFLRRIAVASKTKPILLKGAAYLASDHRWADGRKTSDVDLLLAPDALDEFERFLKSGGYETDDELSALDRLYYRKWLHELPPYKHSYRKLEIDVHFRLLPISDPRSFPVDDWIARSDEVKNMSPFRVLDPVDQVLHAIINLGHTGEFRRATRDAWDIYCLINPATLSSEELLPKETAAPFDWSELQLRTEQLHLQKTVANILLLAEELVGLPIPQDFVEEIAGKSKDRLRQSFIYRTMKTASLPEGPTLRSRKRYFALWALEHYPLPKPSTWLDPLTWTKRFHFMTDE